MHYSICKVENFKPDRKIFSNSKVKKSWFGIRTHDHTRHSLKSYPYFIIEKSKFSAHRSRKTHDFQKKILFEIWQK